MKKVLAAALLLSVSSVSYAEAPGGPDCGWGNMLFDGQSGMGPHFAASITNGTSGNATFGMTTGTNGCSTDGTITYGGESMISGMLDELSEDVARGHGEALDAVAVIFGIEKADRAHFAQVTHANFSAIFPTSGVTAKEVVASLVDVMKSDTQLAKYAS